MKLIKKDNYLFGRGKCNGTIVGIESRRCPSPNSKSECGLYDALQLNCETCSKTPSRLGYELH
ncbi:mCG1051090 [Mus musculus]|nr:mCG1051090 [Mus musculus]